MEILFLTGMSGAGKSAAVRYLEDCGYFCMDNVPPYVLPDLVRSFFKGRNGGKAGSIAIPIIGSVMQMFFCLDVIAAVFACFKEKRHVKLTITVLAAPPVIFGILMALLIGTSAVR